MRLSSFACSGWCACYEDKFRTASVGAMPFHDLQALNLRYLYVPLYTHVCVCARARACTCAHVSSATHVLAGGSGAGHQ